MSLRISTLRVAAALGAALVISGCGSGSPNPIQPPPPPPQNLAPVVQSVEIEDPRVEVDTSIRMVAIVQDAETAADQLRYEWTATAGTFEGEGREVRWRAPGEIQEPMNVSFSLDVVETVNRNGVEQTNRTTYSVPATVRVHNSIEELTELAAKFLDDFTNDSVSPSRTVRNFSDSCPGKQSELRDIEAVRSLFTMLPDSKFSIRSVTIGTPWERGQISARCEFVSRAKSSGLVDTAAGTCLLTAIYETDEWWLCDSHFDGTATNPLFMIR